MIGFFILISGGLFIVYSLSKIKPETKHHARSETPAVDKQGTMRCQGGPVTEEKLSSLTPIPSFASSNGANVLQTSCQQVVNQRLTGVDIDNLLETDRIQKQNAAKIRTRQNALRKERLITLQRQRQAQNPWSLNRSVAAVSDQIKNETNPAKRMMLFQERKKNYQELRVIMKKR